MFATKLKLRFLGDKCLRQRSAAVKSVGIPERLLIAAMLKTMYEHKGIGLAAPQVGINQQIFVADIGQGPMAVINPKVIKKFGIRRQEEGCLSIPEVSIKVKRPVKIEVEYMDEDSHVIRREFVDLAARVFLHETDHLHGKLIIDYANVIEKRKYKDQIQKLETEHKGLS